MTTNLDIPLSRSDSIEMCIALCTAPDYSCATNIAKSLIEEKLAACVTLLPNAKSIYYWQGELEQKNEIQLIIKSRLTLKQKIFKNIKSYHPYQIPELIIIPVISVDSNYLMWINSYLC